MGKNKKNKKKKVTNIKNNTNNEKELKAVEEKDVSTDKLEETPDLVQESSNELEEVVPTEEKSDNASQNENDNKSEETNNTEDDKISKDKKSKKKNKKEKKEKKKLTKKKKVAILLSVLIIIIVGVAIALPLALRANKLFISDISQLNEALSKGKKFNTIILKNDINIDKSHMQNGVYNFPAKNIVLNDKSINVNEGILNFGSQGSSDSYSIGSEKDLENKKSKIEGLNLAKINIFGADVSINASLVAKEIEIKTNNLTVNREIKTKKDVLIETLKSTVKNPTIINSSIASETSNINIKSSHLLINGKLIIKPEKFAILGEKSNSVLEKNANVLNIKLLPEAVINSKGKTKYILGTSKNTVTVSNHKVEKVENINNLLLHTNDALIGIIINSNLTKIERIPTPSGINIMPTVDGHLKLQISKSLNADKYKILIDKKEIKDIKLEYSTENLIPQFDVTKYLITPGKHSIDVIAQSNNNKILLDSLPVSIEYESIIVLPAPTGLKVNLDGNTYNLTFNKVHLAKEYLIFVNGVKVDTKHIKALSTSIKVNLNDYLVNPASYEIKIQALNSSQKDIKPSKFSLTSIVIEKKFAPVKKLVFKKLNNKYSLSWDKVEKAKYYSVYLKTETDTIFEKYCSCSVNVFDFISDKKYTAARVVVEQEGYNTTSDVAEALLNG